MSWIDAWWARVRPWIRRSAVEREIEEEFAFHAEQEAEQHRAAGLDDDLARRAARVRFGATAQYREEVRDVWSGRLGGVGADIRRALRRIAHRPGVTLTVVLTFGLGIGANAAVFSLVQSTLVRPLPYADPGTLVVFWHRSGDLADDTWFSLRELVEYRIDAAGSFSGIGAYTDAAVNLTEGEPERVLAAFVTDDLFDTLGTPALMGRTIGPDDARPGGARVVVLGHGLWQRQFGGRLDIVGATIRVSGRPATVIGVMPPSFRLPLDYREPRPTEVFLPNPIDTSQELAWGDRSYLLVARLAEGVTPGQAAAAMGTAHGRWKERVAELADDDLDARLPTPVRDLLFRDVGRALVLLFAAVGLLLFVACANVAHLLLASGDARRRELATQAVLGASRRRLVTQLLAENAALAMLGGVAGVAVAQVVVRAALALAPVNAIRAAGATIDLTVLTFTACVAVAATLASGVLPAVVLSRVQLGEALAGARGTTGTMRRTPQRLLVVGEMAASLVLVLCAALIAQSYAAFRRIELGFVTRGVATVRVDLPPADYQTDERANRFFKDIVGRFAALPDVDAAGAVRVLPLSGTIGDWSITLEHRPTRPGENPNGDWQVVTPGYFEALGIHVRRGRSIRPSDDELAPLVAIVSETMAARYWPGEDAIGRRFHLSTGNQPWIEIVGIAPDIRHNAVVEEPRAEMYIPHAQWPRANGGGQPRYGMTLVARTTGDPADVLPRLREEIRALDPRLPVSDARPMDAVAADALAGPRFTTLLFGSFAALAMGLAAIGLYGVVSFVTASRTREVGVRLALGARPASVCGLLVRDSLALSGAGVALGLVAAAWVARLLTGQLYGISALDPATFTAAPVVLLAVAALASCLPAMRAARSNPVETLRLE